MNTGIKKHFWLAAIMTCVAGAVLASVTLVNGALTFDVATGTETCSAPIDASVTMIAKTGAGAMNVTGENTGLTSGRITECRVNHPMAVADFVFDKGLGTCTTFNYRDLLALSTEDILNEKAFVICNAEGRERDTSWHLETGLFNVSGSRDFAILVRAHGDFNMVGTLPPSCVMWFGKNGKPLETMDALNQRIPLVTVIGFAPGLTEWRSTLIRGYAPAGAGPRRARGR